MAGSARNRQLINEERLPAMRLQNCCTAITDKEKQLLFTGVAFNIQETLLKLMDGASARIGFLYYAF